MNVLKNTTNEIKYNKICILRIYEGRRKSETLEVISARAFSDKNAAQKSDANTLKVHRKVGQTNLSAVVSADEKEKKKYEHAVNRRKHSPGVLIGKNSAGCHVGVTLPWVAPLTLQ